MKRTRPRPTLCLLVALCAVSSVATAQRVEELQLLPPLGESDATESAIGPFVLDSDDVIGGENEPNDSWWPSTRWFVSPAWDIGAELGINGSAGNAQAFSLVAAFSGKRETEHHVLGWDLNYAKTQTGGSQTQHYGLFNSRWDWKMSPLWLLYNKNVFEYDEFKAFDVRLVLSGGVGRHLIKNDKTTITARAGAGASREFGGPDENWTPEANAGGDFEQQISERQKLKITTDYYPAWETLSDYRLVTNAYWEILLDDETNLSLKLGAVDRYDSTPNGAKANDIDYYATLLFKL